MGETVRKIWNAVTTVIVVLAVTAAVLLVGARLVGLQVFTVLSGSMEPTYHVGALIYVKSVDYTELEVGDPISFMMDEDTVATHRIIEIIPDEDDPSVIRFRTKGDANEITDMGLVHCKNVLGKPVFTIPKLGYAASFIQHPPGLYYAVAFAIVLILLCFLPDMLDGDTKKNAEHPEKECAPLHAEYSETGDTAPHAERTGSYPEPVYGYPGEDAAPHAEYPEAAYSAPARGKHSSAGRTAPSRGKHTGGKHVK